MVIRPRQVGNSARPTHFLIPPPKEPELDISDRRGGWVTSPPPHQQHHMRQSSRVFNHPRMSPSLHWRNRHLSEGFNLNYCLFYLYSLDGQNDHVETYVPPPCLAPTTCEKCECGAVSEEVRCWRGECLGAFFCLCRGVQRSGGLHRDEEAR